VKYRSVAIFLALIAVFFCMGASVWAQTGVSLSGVVTDQTGAGLPDVAVTIKNVDTTATRTIATDGGGRYQASGLPAGQFEIRAAKPGFADATRTGINVADGQGATVDTKMQVKTPDPCTSGHEFATTDCTLTWHGVTLYGAYDVGVGWVSHGLPEPAADGPGHQGQGRVPAWLVRRVQRFNWHQSAVRPARQRVTHRYQQ
jgi:hypothetical protein